MRDSGAGGDIPRNAPLMLWLAPAWTGAPLLPPCPCGPRTLELSGDQLGGYPPGLPPLGLVAGGGLWQPHHGPQGLP